MLETYLKENGGEGGIRIHPPHGNKGVLRRTLAFYGTEKEGAERLVPPYCPPNFADNSLRLRAPSLLTDSFRRAMARVFRFVDILGCELHTINDPEDELPIPQTMQVISIGHSRMRVEPVTLKETGSRAASIYSVRVRAVSFLISQPFKN